jgi:hypothetical protein
MSDDTKKPVRVQFGPNPTAKEIFSAIREQQDAWAKSNPARAHELYPNTYDEQGDRIPKPPSP